MTLLTWFGYVTAVAEYPVPWQTEQSYTVPDAVAWSAWLPEPPVDMSAWQLPQVMAAPPHRGEAKVDGAPLPFAPCTSL